MNVVGGTGWGKITAAAGTVINRLIPPRAGAITRLDKFSYTPGATSHTLTVMRPLGLNTSTGPAGQTTLSAAAASGQAVVNIVANPGPSTNLLQANDWVCILEKDGVYRVYQVQSITTLAVTLTSNLVAGANAGAPLWDFGQTTDVNPADGLAHPQFAAATGAALVLPTDAALETGLIASYNTNNPLLLQSNNATNAGTVDWLIAKYTQAGGAGGAYSW